MHPLFPYVAGALLFGAFVGLIIAVNSALGFRDEVRAWQACAEARVRLEHEKLQAALTELKDAGHRRDIALERQAGELMQHRLSLPPPRVHSGGPRGRAQTSEDWDDDGRATVVRASQPPPLPAFERPIYMAR